MIMIFRNNFASLTPYDDKKLIFISLKIANIIIKQQSTSIYLKKILRI